MTSFERLVGLFQKKKMKNSLLWVLLFLLLINQVNLNLSSNVLLGLTGDEFEFDSLGDGPARYNVVHFKRVSISPARWEWVRFLF
jgi:hypothetical protein